jgi:hypothetical protein
MCTVTVTLNHYDSSTGDTVIDAQQSVHVLRVLPYIIILK